MLRTLAWRELWHVRWTLLLQVASLAIAIAALTATEHLRDLTHAGPVPGSGCSENVVELAAVKRDGTVQDTFTPRQARALLAALPATPAADLLYSDGAVDTRNGRQPVTVAYVGPRYFEVVCVARHDVAGVNLSGAFVEGAVIEETLSRQLIAPRVLHSNSDAIALQGSVRDFKGTHYRNQPVQAWRPMEQAKAMLEHAGSALDALTISHVLVRPGAGQSREQLFAVLDRVIGEQPGLFNGIQAIQAAPTAQMDAGAAEKVSTIALLLRLFAGALLFMVLVNLVIYHAGRLPAAQALAHTLKAVGVPPAALRLYAAIEPVVVGLLAAPIGIVLSLPLAKAAIAAVTRQDVFDGAARALAPSVFALGLTVAVTAIAIWARAAAFSTRSLPTRGKAKRLLLAYLPALLAVQVGLGLLTLSLATQSALGLVRALPPPPHFPLEGLTVVSVLQAPGAPMQYNPQLRWDSAWQQHAVPGYQVALSLERIPFLPNNGAAGLLNHAGRSITCYYADVSANFFQVLGAPVSEAATAPPFRLAGTDQLVLNPQAAQDLFAGTPAIGALVRTNRDPQTAITAHDPAAAVMGVFDDGIVGARGATGKIEWSQLSMQAPVPVAYTPMQKLWPMLQLELFVRHPLDQTPEQVAIAILPAVRALLPTAHVVESHTALEMFRAPLSREHAMAWVLGLLAVASLAIGMLGLIALLGMLTQSLKVEMAVRYAVGATRQQAGAILIRRLLKPFVLGLLLAAIPTIGALFLLGQLLEAVARAGLWGPTLGVAILVGTLAGVLWHAARQIARVDFMDWLRYE